MYRATPKLVMLLLIGGVVAAIFWKMRDTGDGPQQSSSVVYVNPNATPSPAGPAPTR
jgi:hypothetical protein